MILRKVAASMAIVLAGAFVLLAARAQTPAWKQLFNGKDLTGWKHVGPGEMTVEDGLIRTNGGMGLLYLTAGKMANCRIRVVYKMRDSNDNSGVFIRIPIEPREPWMPVHYGYEVQIDNHRDIERRRVSRHGGSLFADQTARQTRQARPGVETRWRSRSMDRARS